MADDGTKISVTQEVRNPRRNSIGIPESPDNGKPMLPRLRRASVGPSHVGGNTRRNSTGKPTPRNSSENVIPNYLRASTGSCHDMCKYGRKHTNEVKPWKSKPKRTVASSSEEPRTTIVVAGDRKKTTMVKLKPSPEPPEVIKQNNTSVVPGERKKTTMVKLEPSPEPPEVIKQNISTVVTREKKKSTAVKLEPSPEHPEVIKQNTTTVVTREKKKTTVVKLESSPEPPKVIKQKNAAVAPRLRKKTAMVKIEPSPEPLEVIKQSYKTLVPGERKKATMGKLKSSPEPPEVIKREILLPSKRVEVSSNRDSLSARKSTLKDLKMPAKRSPSLKPKPAVGKPPSLTDASVGSDGRRKSDMKTGKKMGPIKAVVKKVVLIPTLSLSPKSPASRVLNFKARKGRNLKQVSPFKDQKWTPKVESVPACNDKIHEKTMRIVESVPVNSEEGDGIMQSLPSPPSPSALSPKSSPHANSQGSYSEQDDLDYSVCTNSEEDDDYISENDETVSPSGLETVEGDEKRVTRKGKSSLPEDKDAAAAVKLKFRRGRIVDVQSEHNSPRKLRFRRGRVLGGEDDQSGSRRRTYKKRGDEETKDSRLGAEKVVLKHQDVQDKKDTQGLFNNVIEETATKLAETRKSKVKALVGAFETVISLQDGKPSTQTVT